MAPGYREIMHHGNKKTAEVHSILIGVGFAFIAIYVKLRLFFFQLPQFKVAVCSL